MSERGQNRKEPDGERGAALRAAALRLSRREGRRAAAAWRELTEPSPIRLTDRQRYAIERLCAELVGDIEDELRGLILADDTGPGDEALAASLGAAHVPLARPILEAAGMLPDRALAGLALRRSDMHETARRLRRDTAGDPLAALVVEADSAKSGAAMALLIAESRANFRFEEPVLPACDLPRDMREALVWQIAAALRHYACAHHSVSAGTIDEATSRAAAGLCATLAEETGLGAAAADLAAAFGQGIDGELLSGTLGAGRTALYCALLAKISEIAADDVWTLVSDPAGIGHALLLRAAGVERQAGADLILAVLDALGEAATGDGTSGDSEPPAWLAAWSEFTAETASGALAHWRIDPAYRQTLAALRFPERGPTP